MTAFSNASEFDYWKMNWCQMCARDELGTADEGTFCPILDVVMLDNVVPAEWSPGTDDLRDRYHCSGFQ